MHTFANDIIVSFLPQISKAQATSKCENLDSELAVHRLRSIRAYPIDVEHSSLVRSPHRMGKVQQGFRAVFVLQNLTTRSAVGLSAMSFAYESSRR